MDTLWIYAAVFAAFVQSLRFMLQKQVKDAGLSTAAATFARFVYAAPVVGVGALFYANAQGGELPALAPGYWGYVLLGGVSQILGTVAVVILFSHRNFAVGMTFKKTEVMLTVLSGYLILGDSVSPLGVAAIVVGFFGVLALSGQGARFAWRDLISRASLIGLASGVIFSISGPAYRGATLAVASDDPLIRASITLACATAIQTLILLVWMLARERDQLRAVFIYWRLTGMVAVASMLGSMGWFTAYTLQSAAYVNAVGQVELIFSMIISYFVFSERSTMREYAGIALICVSVVALILLG
jgi:drug/metabolite transporter (DMT)-like permease